MQPMHQSRFVSLLTRKTLALIMAGGRGSRLKHLTNWRVKPAVPFGGKFRIIDFPLSNCVNSGIRQIGVLTQYKAHSLIQHVQRGWSFLRGEFGEFVEILPAQQRVGEGWYAGTADAIYQNLYLIERSGAKFAVDTCCVVAPIRGRFRTMATDSAKACYYAASKNRMATRFLDFDSVVAEALVK